MKMAGKSEDKTYGYRRTKAYRDLKRDMLDDLELRGLVGKQYIDMVEAYMDLWCQRKMLNEDVAKRGVFLEYSNGSSQKGTTENKSIALGIKASSEMRSIFSALGFREQATSSKPQSGGEDDEL